MAVSLWEQYRDQFPITKKLVYLNHASVAPLSRRAAEAMQGLAADALEYGSEHYARWLAAYEGVRNGAAKLLNAEAGEIAIIKNTSEGIATIAMGIAWKPGDAVVIFEEEFPANLYPWKRLADHGVEVRQLSIFDDLDQIDQAAKGARLLAISYVQYLSGYRVDLDAIGEICRRRGCIFCVDAIQGMGAFPIDVRKSNIGALSADGHKWLLGPEGCGVLFVERSLQDQIEPAEFGWTNVARYADYASRDMTLRSDAGRYECGTLNTIGCFGLEAAFELLLEIGVDRISKAVQALGDQVWHGARELGYETLGRRPAGGGAGIVSIRKPGVESPFIVRKLRDAGFTTAPRQGWVRIAPHFYISPDDIDALLRILRTF
ncbi:MAG TPA: aminotransferase class V-fold PLP-dependent enzyme [Bryobacteraceae bacterium]|nr:aminotransferase class V-fold PLP-dependent enzyme [Bryobacteraceae bacterium]